MRHFSPSGLVALVLVLLVGVDVARADVTPGAGLGFLHPIATGPASLETQCRALPPDVRQRVHVLFLNGADPLCLGNVNGLCAHVQALGFPAEFHQLWQASALTARVRQIQDTDPQARIVLVAFSAGTIAARSLVHDLARQGRSLDLLVYLAGDYLDNAPRSRPGNVRRILNITGHGLLLSGYNLLWKGVQITGARNIRLDVRHILVPSQPETVQAVTEEILRVADLVGH